MSSKLRQSVPKFWVLLSLVTFSAIEISSLVEAQFWQAEPSYPPVTPDLFSLDFSAYLCTVQVLSWPPGRMSHLSTEQKQKIKDLYKTGRKIAHSEAHIEFLLKCLDFDFIPKSFRLKNNIPRNQKSNKIG